MNYLLKKKLHTLLAAFILATFFSGILFAETYKNHLSDAWYPVKGKLLSVKIQGLQTIAQKKYPMTLKPSSIRAIICPHAGYDIRELWQAVHINC